MRCLVLGHSGTAGFGLTSVDQTWPALLARILADSGGEEWPVSAAPLFPMGDRAIEYALARTADIQPDLVVLSLNAFPCVVPVVAASVRHRFGRRAERLYTRVERRLEARARSREDEETTNRSAQRWARRLLGTRTMTDVEEVGRVYSEILRGLARLEGIQVAVLAEALFRENIRRRVHGLTENVDRLRALVRPTAERHRFLWCDATEWLAPDGGEPHWHRDGVHLSARGNARYAEMLAVCLGGKLRAGT